MKRYLTRDNITLVLAGAAISLSSLALGISYGHKEGVANDRLVRSLVDRMYEARNKTMTASAIIGGSPEVAEKESRIAESIHETLKCLDSLGYFDNLSQECRVIALPEKYGGRRR